MAPLPAPPSTSDPLGLIAWRQLQRGAALGPLADPDRTAATLVRRWHQHFAVAIDGPMEQAGSGAERLPQLLDAWLDVARRSAPVREFVARHAGPRTTAEQRRQDRLLTGLLAEDLALLGEQAPVQRAADLVRELAAVATAEDRVGHPLPASRAALLRGTGAAPVRTDRSCPVSRLIGPRLSAWLHLSPAG